MPTSSTAVSRRSAPAMRSEEWKGAINSPHAPTTAIRNARARTADARPRCRRFHHCHPDAACTGVERGTGFLSDIANATTPATRRTVTASSAHSPIEGEGRKVARKYSLAGTPRRSEQLGQDDLRACAAPISTPAVCRPRP